MNIEWHDIVGIAGVALIAGSYLLLQLERIESRDPMYPAMNALGAGLVLVSLVFDFNLSAFVIESFWIVISLIGLYRSVRGRDDARQSSRS